MIPILEISEAFADEATPADFPKHILRYRNQEASASVGFGDLSDAAWLDHFGRFEPLPGNLQTPLALRYHGHQFHVYNPDLGDGRGFLFAQIKAEDGRLLDLGTKGSGQTRWSRQGDGRLTLKGGVREVLAGAYLQALGVRTSTAFSLIETGEPLHRNDEPSPTRSSVLVRLLHSHLRFGTFQRVAYYDDKDAMAQLIQHVIAQYYPDCADESLAISAPALLERIAERTAQMIAQWMAAGFVHGVMNTDNFNVTGETFDFGPWRFLETSDPNFTAAYFDQNGLYRFGRQPTQGLWALQQLGGALSLICDADELSPSLGAYAPAYRQAFADHTFHLLGLQSDWGLEDDLTWLQAFYGWMTESGAIWPQVFFDWFGGQASAERAKASPQSQLYDTEAFAPVRAGIEARSKNTAAALATPYFQQERPVSLLVDDVERIWKSIDEQDDWTDFDAQLTAFKAARHAYELR